MTKNTRYYFIDLARGLLIIFVVLFHLIFDLNMYKIIDFDLTLPFFEILKSIGVLLFCIISGISINLSRNNIKRAITLIGFAYVLTLITYIFNNSSYDLFGILHVLGFSALIYSLFKKHIDKLFGRYAPIVWFLLFLIFRLIPFPYVNIPHLYAFGFMQPNFSSIDYYPLIPWLFAFLLGTSLTDYVVKEKLPQIFYTLRSKPLEFLGKHSLIVYLAHQPLFIGIIMIIK